MNIAVVGQSTHLLHFSRMDNAKLTSINIAIDKAFTAAGHWYLHSPLHLSHSLSSLYSHSLHFLSLTLTLLSSHTHCSLSLSPISSSPSLHLHLFISISSSPSLHLHLHLHLHLITPLLSLSPPFTRQIFVFFCIFLFCFLCVEGMEHIHTRKQCGQEELHLGWGKQMAGDL
jgi:Haem-degrading